MDYRESIEKTRQSFEDSFAENSFYNRQTRDEKHLEEILCYLPVSDGMKILDLGTGTGFLAFPLAEKYPQTRVTGLDIVEKALDKNRERAESKGLKNLQFISYEGMEFPFMDHTFDMVVTRYALHHFPEISDTFREIDRVLKPDGIFFLSDPAPNENDTERFVDAYMQMKKDRHIRFYTKEEWVASGRKYGLSYVDGFETSIRFPKKKADAKELDAILAKHDRSVVEGYKLEITEDEIWITEKVNNLMFLKAPVRGGIAR